MSEQAMRAELVVFANIESAQRSIDALSGRISRIANATKGRKLFPDFEKELKGMEAQLASFNRAVGRELLPVRSLSQELAANAKQVRTLTAEYRLLDTQLEKTVQVTGRLRQIEAQVSSLGGSIDNLGRRASGGNNLDTFLAKLQSAGGVAGGLGRGLGSVTALMARFGLTARDVGIALGAGFLTSGPAIVLLLGVLLVGAISKAIFAMAKLGSQLIQLRQITARAVGDASAVISEFARTASTDFGITEASALQFVNRAARLFQSFGTITKEASATLGAGLVEVAEILRVTSGTGLSMNDALDRIFNTISGNIEGLREFNIFMTEISLKQLAARHGIELTSETLDAQERSLLATIAAYDAAIKAVDDYNSTNATLDQEIEGVKAQIGTLVAQVGQHLAPAFLIALESVADFLEGISNTIEGFKNLQKEIRSFIDNQPLLQKALGAIVTVLRKLQPVFDAAVRVIEYLDASQKKNTKTTDKQTASTDRLRREQDKAIATLRQKNIEEGRSIEGLKKLIDLEEKAAEARREATKAIGDAQIALARAREDGARRIQDANRDVEEALRDQAEKNADALDAVREAEEDAERAIFDAREKLADAKTKRDRAIRDAEEKLAKARLESARKVDDAERQLADARRKRNEEIVDAQLSLDEALAQGDANAERKARLDLSRAQNSRAVVDAEKDVREAELERIEKIKEAERDLKETRIDAFDAVSDAQRNLERVISDSEERISDALEKLRRTRRESAKEVEEALRRFHEIEVDNNRALFDAQNRLNEVVIEGRQRIQETQDAADELRRKYGRVKKTVEELKDELERVLNVQLTINRALRIAASLLPFGAGNVFPEGHAHGGHYKAGMPRFVGERGIELDIPYHSGAIVSNSQLMKALAKLGGKSAGGGNSYYITESVNPDALSRAIEARWSQQVNN